ncbi:TetR family transcriptional regulator [Pantoea sp. BAV 3049]|uniref:TetR family transcriptional regulator n=1 Tax=Pantoea sp. BAV 3049 TaxID=2654188 RepID=UPI00351B38F3
MEAILQAATQVLAREGVQRFTTARVAEAAGVSIGSLYQYFPNKAALLFRLQCAEWQETSDMLSAILQDRTMSTEARLRKLVMAFIHSEYEEAATRSALADAAPLYRSAPEAQQVKAAGSRVFLDFIQEALPELAENKRSIAANLLLTTFRDVGKSLSVQCCSHEEIDAYAEQMATMFCAYLNVLEQNR